MPSQTAPESVKGQGHTALGGTPPTRIQATSMTKNLSSVADKARQPPMKQQKLMEPLQVEEDTLSSESSSSDENLPLGLFP